MTSLRERNKARTRAELQRHALRLFTERGYGATTVDDIAAAGGVARSTFFRYFPSKEDVVLFDDVDPLLEQNLAATAPDTPLLTAFVDAVRTTLTGLDDDQRAVQEARMRLAHTEPEVAAALRTSGASDVELITRLAARAVAREPDDLDVVIFAGAMTGAVVAARVLVAREPDRTYADTIVEILDRLRTGIPLVEEPVVDPS